MGVPDKRVLFRDTLQRGRRMRCWDAFEKRRRVIPDVLGMSLMAKGSAD